MSVLSEPRPAATRPTPGPARRRRPALRAAAALLTVALLAAAAGAVAEAALARGDAARHPAPGELVEVAGERLHVRCSGAGDVTVVLEAGLVDPAAMFDPLREALTADARVCAYDRPGHGWAGAPTGSQSPMAQADRLARVFEGPLVVVAHSVGAGVARAFTERHRDRLAGLVLLDPTNTETLATTPAWLLAFAGGAQLRAGELAGRLGLLRAFDQPIGARLLPDAAPAAVLADAQHHLRPAVLAAARAELRAHRRAAADLDALVEPGSLGELPLIVVSSADATDTDRAFHERLAAMSSSGRHLVADSGGHHIHLDEPALVRTTVRNLPARQSASAD